MPTATIDDVWIYIYDQGNVRTRDLEQRFVKTRQMARATMYKYKHRLELEGKIQSKPVHAKPPYHLYYVPSSMHPYVEALQHYKTLPNVIGGDIDALPWRDIPDGWALLPVKEKILWHDPERGAMAVLQRIPVTRARKEGLCVAYWDGPRTKVNVPYTASYDSPRKIFKQSQQDTQTQ